MMQFEMINYDIYTNQKFDDEFINIKRGFKHKLEKL